jgi:hypothetical protein
MRAKRASDPEAAGAERDSSQSEHREAALATPEALILAPKRAERAKGRRRRDSNPR